MACINPNDPDFQKILKEVGGNPLLAAIEFNELYPEETVPEIKPGVEEVFDSNPELASIGTPEQYSQYLDTVFPDSKVKDIVYHGSTQNFDRFDSSKKGSFSKSKASKKGYFFTTNLREATIYSKQGVAKFEEDSLMPDYSFSTGKVLSVIVNTINPKIVSTEDVLDDSEEKEEQLNTYVVEAIENKNDGFIWNANVENYETGNVEKSNEIVVFEADNTHILGSKQDIEGFKNFVENRSFNQLELDPELSNYLAEQISQAFNVPIPTMEKDTLITADEIDAFNRDVENRDGALPKEYFTGVDDVNKWSLNQSNLYDLVDKDTGEIYLRDVNLSTGMMEKKETTPEPVPEKERQEAIDYINNSVKEFRLDEILAERGYDVNDIISNLASAENKEEFNKIINKLLRLLC